MYGQGTRDLCKISADISYFQLFPIARDEDEKR